MSAFSFYQGSASCNGKVPFRCMMWCLGRTRMHSSDLTHIGFITEAQYHCPLCCPSSGSAQVAGQLQKQCHQCNCKSCHGRQWHGLLFGSSLRRVRKTGCRYRRLPRPQWKQKLRLSIRWREPRPRPSPRCFAAPHASRKQCMTVALIHRTSCSLPIMWPTSAQPQLHRQPQLHGHALCAADSDGCNCE